MVEGKGTLAKSGGRYSGCVDFDGSAIDVLVTLDGSGYPAVVGIREGTFQGETLSGFHAEIRKAIIGANGAERVDIVYRL